jgi:tRNA A37 methylthiotransferase MiaB
VAILTALAEKGHREYEKAWTGRELTAIVEHRAPGQLTRVRTANYLSAALSATSDASDPERGAEIRIILGDNNTARLVN